MKITQTSFTFFFSFKLALNLDQFKLIFLYFPFLALPIAMLSFLALSLLIIQVILEEGTQPEERNHGHLCSCPSKTTLHWKFFIPHIIILIHIKEPFSEVTVKDNEPLWPFFQLTHISSPSSG